MPATTSPLEPMMVVGVFHGHYSWLRAVGWLPRGLRILFLKCMLSSTSGGSPRATIIGCLFGGSLGQP